MRQIHPVGFQEKFVASGLYTHYRDEKPSGLVEHWTIHELPDQSQLVRVDWDGRFDRVGWSILLEALYSQNDNTRIERLTEWALGNVNDRIKKVEVDYVFFDDHVEINRRIDSNLILEHIDLPPNYVVFPGTRLFLGLMISQAVAQKDNKITVLRNNPHFVDDTAFESFINDGLDFTFLGQENIIMLGDTLETRHYDFEFMVEPDRKSNHPPQIWLDKHDILLRLKNLQDFSRTELTQYARRPELHKS